MSDIGLFFEDEVINIKLENGDLVADSGLETAILISLFSDQRVTEDELPKGNISKRGYWGDLYEDDKIGSKLWVYDRGKVNLETLTNMEKAAEDSLNWLITDGVAKSITIEGEFINNGINLQIEVTKQDDIKNLFKVFWNEQEIKRA